MLSTLELCHLIESAFLPLSCECRVDPVGYLQAQIVDPVSGRAELLVTGLSIEQLNGNQAITKLIDEIRGDIKAIHEKRRDG